MLYRQCCAQKKLGAPDSENRRLPAEFWRDVDPLICPRCQGPMRVISIIEDQPVIRQILTHQGLWDEPPRGRPPPWRHAPPAESPVSYAEGYHGQPGPADMICDPIYPDEWYFS